MPVSDGSSPTVAGEEVPRPRAHPRVLCASPGCVAKTSVAPLDRVKILFQTKSPEYQRYAGQLINNSLVAHYQLMRVVGTWLGVFRASKDIYAETGVRGLLQGHSATILRIFPYAAIKFMSYEKFHTVSARRRSIPLS